jgi:hypothetical protein
VWHASMCRLLYAHVTTRFGPPRPDGITTTRRLGLVGGDPRTGEAPSERHETTGGGDQGWVVPLLTAVGAIAAALAVALAGADGLARAFGIVSLGLALLALVGFLWARSRD